MLSAYTTKEMALEVIPRGRTTTKLVFDRVELEIRREGVDRVLRLDTRQPPKEAGADPGGEVSTFFRRSAALKALAGRSLEVVQSPTGLIEEFAGVDLVREAMLKEGPDEAFYKMGVEAVLSRGYLTDTLRPYIIMPDHGFTGNEVLHFRDVRLLPDVITGVKGLLYYKGTYHLVEAKDGLARVEMEAEVSLDPYDDMPPWPGAAAAGRQRLRLQRGACRAWAKVRTETGVLEEAEHVTDLDLHYVKPEGKGEVPIPVKVTLKVQRIP